MASKFVYNSLQMVIEFSNGENPAGCYMVFNPRFLANVVNKYA